jgi:AcrR family transcriptional regulator
MGTPKDSKKTRAKLIEAAGQLFAEKGFNGVTVRDIAQKADTHLSALNYHFRTKEALYHEVLMEACRSDSISSEDKEQLLKMNSHDALSLLIKEALKQYRKLTASNWRMVVITRECWEPSPSFEEVSREYFKPEASFLAELIGRAVGKPSADPNVRFAVISMIGLLETFGLYGHLIDAVAPGLDKHFKKKNGLAEHIVQLVLTAASSSITG